MRHPYQLTALAGLLLSMSGFAEESTASNTVEPQPHHLGAQSMVQIAKPVAFKALISNQNRLNALGMSTYQATDTRKVVINRSGAGFLKLHFSQLSLPSDGYIEVKSADGSQVHRYGGESPSLYTLRDGDDGVTSFSALTIFGDTAIVEYVGNTHAQYHVEIDNIMQGMSDEELDSPWFEPSSSTSNITPSSTCGVNERKDVMCWADSHPVEFERSRPVARLLINGSGSCTAWRVGPDNRLFTNNHCISSATGPSKTEVWFNYQKSGCNSGSTSGRVIVTGDQMLSTNADLDYSLFTVKRFEDIQQFGHFGLDVRNPIDQERIYIPQHGRGQPKQLSIESDQNGDGLCRVDVTLADGSAPNTDMGYMCDTIGGSSGSPVLAASSNNVIALHHFGGCPNQGVLMNLIWPNVSEHFNNQIPVGDNGGPSGIPVASFGYEADALEVTFTDNSSDGDGQIVGYAWDFGDGSTSSEANPVHTYQSAGDYTVSLTVTDNDGNTNANSQLVSVVNSSNGELQKGIAVSNLSATLNNEIEFYFDVPEEAKDVTFNLSGGSGDADLYVSFNEKPTTSSYDCRPYKGGNTESCVFRNAQPGRYYVMIKAYRAFSNTSIVADYTEQGDTVSFSDSNLSDSRGGWKHYTLEVPANLSELTAQISGGSGDADLYVRFGAEPTKSTYKCRPYKNGNNESCRVTNPQAGTWYISVHAYSNYSGVDIVGEAM